MISFIVCITQLLRLRSHTFVFSLAYLLLITASFSIENLWVLGGYGSYSLIGAAIISLGLVPENLTPIRKNYANLLLFFIIILLYAIYAFLVLDNAFFDILRFFYPFLLIFSVVYFFNLPFGICNRLSKLTVSVALIWVVLYIAQPIFGLELVGKQIEPGRYGGFPLLFGFVFCFMMADRSAALRRLTILGIFLIGAMFYASLGILLACLSVILVAVFLRCVGLNSSVYWKYLFSLGFVSLLAIVFIFIFGAFLNSETSSILFSYGSTELSSMRHFGSFVFRFALLFERLEVLFADPVRLLFGLGFVSDMSVNDFVFKLGTESRLLPLGYEQYETRDMLWPNILTRFGLMGIALYTIVFFSYLRRSAYYAVSGTGSRLAFYFGVFSFVFSFANDTVFQPQYWWQLAIALVLSKPSNDRLRAR